MITHLRSDPRYSFDFLAFILNIVTFGGIERPIFVVSPEVTVLGIKVIAAERAIVR
jgi:hypothetical protein